jgi:RNase P/RNase MRP subunit p29
MSEEPLSQPPAEDPTLGYSSLGSRALVIRDSDAMRNGIRGMVRDVAMNKLVVRLPLTLPANEQIQLKLRNFVQRFRKETRGVVRGHTPDPKVPGSFLHEVELYSRLTPLEVSLLRMGVRDENIPRLKKWV